MTDMTESEFLWSLLVIVVLGALAIWKVPIWVNKYVGDFFYNSGPPRGPGLSIPPNAEGLYRDRYGGWWDKNDGHHGRFLFWTYYDP
jgi:hypothetical protein